MNAIPSLRDLEQAGHDAGALLDAYEADLERAIPMATNDGDKVALAADLKAVRALREEWFGGEA